MKELNITTHIGARIFGANSNFKDRWIKDDNKLKKLVENCKGLGLKIVLTQGTYDMVHIGHARYFEEAKKHGDILIVAVDSDEKVRARKGPERPVVPQLERLEMVTHLRTVDLVYLKNIKSPHWNLIKLICPDVLIATKETYSKAELMQISHAKKLEKSLTPKLLQTIQDVLNGSKDVKTKR